MRSSTNSGEKLFSGLSRLHREVRRVTRGVAAQAEKISKGNPRDFLACVTVLLDQRMVDANSDGKVICLASAVEFGLTMPHQWSCCRAAVLNANSDAVRVLFYTVVRRIQDLHARQNKMPGTREAGRAARRPQGRIVLATAVHAGTSSARATRKHCNECEGLLADARRADGHEELRPALEGGLRRTGAGFVSEFQAYDCAVCGTHWTRHKIEASLFVTWVMRDQEGSH